jgi:hypothetical protein
MVMIGFAISFEAIQRFLEKFGFFWFFVDKTEKTQKSLPVDVFFNPFPSKPRDDRAAGA